jgi:anti-sigma B factor antagonist
MEVQITPYKRCDVVKAEGRIDSFTAPDLEKGFNSILEKERYKIVFDMSNVNFVSSKGWWVMINTQKKCRRYKRGELLLVNVQKEVRDALDLVGMGRYFKMFDDLTSAVGSF